MTRIVWNEPGERVYEAGLDRGVLYIGSEPGVPWNGLISVDELSSGGENVGYYIDGIKYLNNVAPEEYTATLVAFAAPKEFSACDGYAGAGDGLYFGQQPRTPFGLSYRTGIGNDLVGMGFGYKLHFVYNAMVSPNTKSRKTLTDQTDPMQLSLPITVLPVTIAGRRATAHVVVDTREASSSVINDIEDALYGTSSSAPYLPTPLELIAFFME